MKIKTAKLDYEEVLKLPGFVHEHPRKPNKFFRFLLKTLSAGDLKATHFTCKKIGMEKLDVDTPCLFLMNHSSFIDLKIAATILYPRPFNIVCTNDGFVGKDWLMRQIGCIPTRKFMTDIGLVKDMVYAVKELQSSVLMFPEASYTFDGTETPLPDSLGKCLKLLKVPVVMIRTKGAFARDPLYNNLQLRKVDVSAEMEYLLSPEDIKTKSVDELNVILKTQFTYDHFRWQQEQKVKITEDFRADYLNRVLYRCPHCQTEGQMTGKGIYLTCGHCGKQYELTEYGVMKACQGETEFPHIPDWYRWERDCVRKELEEGTYHLEVPVDIYMLVNTDCVYQVGEGVLRHTREGFQLTGCGGRLDYTQKPQNSYSLYSDYLWYEIGDMISIGDNKAQYYCFPKNAGDVVAKTRLAAEELYKIMQHK